MMLFLRLMFINLFLLCTAACAVMDYWTKEPECEHYRPTTTQQLLKQPMAEQENRRDQRKNKTTLDSIKTTINY